MEEDDATDSTESVSDHKLTLLLQSSNVSFNQKPHRDIEKQHVPLRVVGDGDHEAGSDAAKGMGSIAERRAAKCGFNFNTKKNRINTARLRTLIPFASPPSRSPCLTIPPGISPTALLDSPIMLPNSQALPSPTTGTFMLPLSNGEETMATSADPGERGNVAGPYFRFMSHFFNHSKAVKEGVVDHPALTFVQPSTDPEFPVELLDKGNLKKTQLDSHGDEDMTWGLVINSRQFHNFDTGSDESCVCKKSVQGEDAGEDPLLEGEHKGFNSVGTGRTSDDGYNWRKYGQKQVKGSEYPRSYYKCTHPNCQVKKKVERSHDGQITEIIYEGAHNHVKLQPNRRALLGSTFSANEMPDMGESEGSSAKLLGGSIWRSIQPGQKDTKHGSDRQADGLERTSSTIVLNELSDLVTGKSAGMFETAETPELSPTLFCPNDDEEDGATPGSISLGDDATDSESESKRRKKDDCLADTNLVSRSLREPRVVVQIESEVDILDDGYRWRKYGQKVVKGNPNPRSYYKCTSAGCSVRKHVERASHNLKYVIAAYEGKHNHEVPVARNSGQVTGNGNGNGNGNGDNVPSNAQALALAGNASVTETETQLLAPHFYRKPEFGNEFMRPSFIGGFASDMKFGSSSLCQINYALPLHDFPVNSNRCATTQTAPMPSLIHDFPVNLPLPFNFPPGNFPLSSFNLISTRPNAAVQTSHSRQQVKENDMKLFTPKRERDENTNGTCIPFVDHANAASAASTSASRYQQVMGNFPS